MRVNQDSLKTQPRCEAAAKQALRERKSVIIDRCNINKARRAPWTQLAQQMQSPCCAVWLDIGADLAANRAHKRHTHEGGVTGIKGRSLAKSMAKQVASAQLAA